MSGFVVALVGRPNVGKSTLFNVLTRSRDALVADFPGLTRDRKYGHVDYGDRTFMIIDTGGLSGDSEALDSEMEKQTLLAVSECDVVAFMVDAREGLTPADEMIADSLRRAGRNVTLVVNKTDGLDSRVVVNEFYSLGLGEPVAIAASQKRGIQHLVSALSDSASEAAVSDEEAAADETSRGVKVAIVGPGTTRDSVYIPFERDGRQYTFIDTAGVRRKRSVREAIEKFSVIKSMQAIDSANVVIMMIDARTEIADQDLHLIGYILEAGRALVLTINKWDGLDEYQKDKILAGIDKQLPFVRFAETFFISALHGSGVGKLYAAIDRAYASATRDYSTSELTRLLEKAVQSHQPPMVHGRRIKLRYAHQGGMNPPRIIIHGNQVEKVPAAYQRYLVNFFRDELRSVGTPIKIEFKGGGGNPFAGQRKNAGAQPSKPQKKSRKHSGRRQARHSGRNPNRKLDR